MGKIVIDDDCFAPRKFVFLEYKGSDPLAFVRDAEGLFKKIFEVGSSKVAERRFMWDWTGDPVQVYEHYVVRKEMSAFTTFYFSIRVIGFKMKSKNEGSIRIEFESQARHKYETDNKLMMALWWFYWYIFYGKVRQNFIKLCREYSESLINTVKELYKMQTVET